MNYELKEFIKECDCEEIQSKLDYTHPDFNAIPFCEKHLALLGKESCVLCELAKELPKIVLTPSIEQMLKRIGKSFISLEHSTADNTEEKEWSCECWTKEDIGIWYGQSFRLALIRAWKGILKGDPK